VVLDGLKRRTKFLGQKFDGVGFEPVLFQDVFSDSLRGYGRLAAKDRGTNQNVPMCIEQDVVEYTILVVVKQNGKTSY
jgi:hypothetical protein